MTFRPKQNSKKELILSVVLAVFAVAMLIVGGIVQKIVILYQISAIVFAVVSIQLKT